ERRSPPADLARPLAPGANGAVGRIAQRFWRDGRRAWGRVFVGERTSEGHGEPAFSSGGPPAGGGGGARRIRRRRGARLGCGRILAHSRSPGDRFGGWAHPCT